MKFVVIKGTYHKVQTSKVKEFKPQRIKIIRVISEIRSSNQKVDWELREWHELFSNKFSVISEIRGSNQKVDCELREWHELFSNRFSVISEIRSWYYFAIMIRKTAIRLWKIITYFRLIPLQSHEKSYLKSYLKSYSATNRKSIGYKITN